MIAIFVSLGITFNIACAATTAQIKEAETYVAAGQSQRDIGQFSKAERSYRKALALDPLNTGAITGLIALYRQQGMASKVQLTIAQLTPSQRTALGHSLKRIEVEMLQEQSDLRLARGETDNAIKYLEQAVEVDVDDLSPRIKLATLYAERNQTGKGRMLLEDFLGRHPDDNHARYISADYLADHGESIDALKLLNGIDPVSRTPEMIALHKRLALLTLGPEARALIDAGKTKEAMRLVSEAEAFSSGNDEQLLQVACVWAEIGELSRGRKLYDHIQSRHSPALEYNGTTNEVRSGHIKIVSASDGRDQAMQQLDSWAALPTAKDIPVGRHLASMYADLGNYSSARKQVDTILVTYPQETYVLNDGWKIAQRSGQLDDEIDYLKKLVIAEPSNPAESSNAIAYENVGIDEFGSEKRINRDWKEKKLAALIDRRSRWLSSSVDFRSRTGTAGVSKYQSVEIPLEYKTPWHHGDEVFFRIDMIKLNAGVVDPTNTDFGSMEFCQPPSPVCTQTLLKQSAQGVSFTAGYQRGDFLADIGTTPQNFPVSNVVGGIQNKGDLGVFGYSLEASRRPVTATLLSYAGTRDPNTGIVWGGVVATGGSFGLSLDSGEAFGFWSSLGLHNLTGRNVLTNRRLQFMAGEQWRIINETNRRFVIGLTGMYWDFSENAGEYSFGHGGYYSPHNYRSLSFPVTYTARSPRFSYMLRASVSASRSQTRAAPFFPTDSALQAASGSTYSASSGNGRGYSLNAAIEHQVTQQLFLGGLLTIERSDYYAPNQALIYLRYSIDHSGAQPVFMPPEPVLPSSQFY